MLILTQLKNSQKIININSKIFVLILLLVNKHKIIEYYKLYIDYNFIWFINFNISIYNEYLHISRWIKWFLIKFFRLIIITIVIMSLIITNLTDTI